MDSLNPPPAGDLLAHVKEKRRLGKGKSGKLGPNKATLLW